MHRFRQLDPTASQQPTAIPESLIQVRTTYSSGVRQYLFSASLNPLPPPTEENLVYFVASLHGKVKYQTVKLYLSAIANFYVEQNQPLRSNSMFQLHCILKGIKRTSSSQQRIRRPITIHILSQFSTLLRPAFSKDLDTVMLWAAFTLAFFGFLRVSEFTYSNAQSFLAVNDIAFIPSITTPDSIQVHIKQSKTDTFRRGTTLAIAKSHSCALLPPCVSTYCNETQVTLLNPYLCCRTVNRSPELYLMLIYENF